MVQSAKLIPSLNLKALPSHRAYARLCGSARAPGQGLQQRMHCTLYIIYDIHLTIYIIHCVALCAPGQGSQLIGERGDWEMSGLVEHRQRSNLCNIIFHGWPAQGLAKVTLLLIPATETESSTSLCLNKAEIFHSLRKSREFVKYESELWEREKTAF